MEQTSFNESSSIVNQNYKKYGTTTSHNNLKRNQQSEALIRHDLTKSDTLQGIAIQYGCSMEQIRRANRLFANDSLFLREFLMIPVNKDSPYYPKGTDQRLHMLSKRANTIAAAPSSSSSKDFSPNESIESLTSPDEEHRKYMEEFLDKIDSSIASSKKLVKEQQKNSDYISASHSDDSLFSSGSSFINHNYDLAHPSTSYQQYYDSMNSHQQARHSLGGTNDTTQLIVKTQGRHVRNSLQRLEKQQDEIFEL